MNIMSKRFNLSNTISIYRGTTAINTTHCVKVLTVPNPFQNIPQVQVQRVYYIPLDGTP